MSNLTYLFLSNNPYFKGHGIPEWIVQLTDLTDLSLRDTNRTGIIPDFFLDNNDDDNNSTLDRLVMLDLSWNSLSGSIPSSFGYMSNLEFILLNNNLGITGTIPSSFSNATQLRAIFVDGTRMNGTLDDTICTLPNFINQQEDDQSNANGNNGIVEYINNAVAYANCLGEYRIGNHKAIECSCCTCCNASQVFGCSRPYLSNLEASWETNFRRISYSFVNQSIYWDSSLYPHLA